MNKFQIAFLINIMEKIDAGRSEKPKPHIHQFVKEYGINNEDMLEIKKHLFSLLSKI